MAWQTPIVVLPPAEDGGRQVLVRGQHLGTAHSDRELIEMLRGTGLSDADMALDDRHLVEWRGAAAHSWSRGS